jgi:C_GCAxxG_C_C family probable redox protein
MRRKETQNQFYTMTEQEIQRRVDKAVALFKQGFNCSQSVFAACADIYGLEDQALALRLSASFGGGIGRMRQTCGAACGMFMLAGLENGSAIEGDAEGKKQNYALVQDLAAKFQTENGSLICAELLGIAPKPQTPTPEARTEAYYQKRPCAEMVASAVRIFLESRDKR